MASRRDELSAHTFARKRTLAAFLQPESGVSDEGAPRPVRAVVPGAVMSVVLVAGCIAWGAIAPSAPPGWDKPGEHIIVDTDSTTRYVVTNDKNAAGERVKKLHPVLNYASAKLVLDQGKGEVIEVSGKDIDESGIAHGATIGIPYAPDRLPDPEDAGTPKEWAVCEKPGAQSGGEPQQGVFVLGGKQRQSLHTKNRLGNGQVLYVEDSETGDQYLVDGKGTKLMLGGDAGRKNPVGRNLLRDLVLRNVGQPQKVSSEWLSSLRSGEPLVNPTLDGESGGPTSVDGLPEDAAHVGMVLKANDASTNYYVVLQDRVQRISPLLAQLYMGFQKIQPDRKPVPVSSLDMAQIPGSSSFDSGGNGWPDGVVTQVNRADSSIGGKSRTTSCSIYTGKMRANGQPELAAWAGAGYPQDIVDDAAGAYVTSGSGLLFQEVSGSKGGGGTQYLLTDSGLRYAMAGGGQTTGGQADASKAARTRLGYEKVDIAQVPSSWAAFLPKGPGLDTKNAQQEQGM